MLPAQYVIDFVLFSFLGWLWETFYCAANSGKFTNRGFLFGPVCPIYGTGGLLLKIVFGALKASGAADAPAWLVFVASMLGSMVLEYSVSWYLEKRFHARWWDYSHAPFNVNGRICLFASLAFGAVGVLAYKVLFPRMVMADANVPAFAVELAALVLTFLLGCDFALTEASLHSLLQKIEELENEFVERGEAARAAVASAPEELRERVSEAKKNAKEKGGELTEAFAERLRGTAAAMSRMQAHSLRSMKKFRAVRPDAEKATVGSRLKELMGKRG